MNSEIEIREVRHEDLETVVQIQEAIIQKNVPSDWVNLVKLQLTKPEGVSVAAVRNGEVIGYLFGEVKHGEFGLEHSGWLEMVGVNPKVMGEGVGAALAKAFFEKFRELGIHDIYTAVRWDSGDLLAFFKHIGFSLSNFINLKTRLD